MGFVEFECNATCFSFKVLEIVFLPSSYLTSFFVCHGSQSVVTYHHVAYLECGFVYFQDFGLFELIDTPNQLFSLIDESKVI